MILTRQVAEVEHHRRHSFSLGKLSHPRMTRAKIEIMEIDLLDLSAKARVLELETSSSETSTEAEGDLPE